MRTTLLASLVVVASGVIAAADPPPRGPDFVAALPSHGAAHGLAASDGTAPIAPLDVLAFANDSSLLLQSAIVQIDTCAKWLRTHPRYKIVLEGHTDHLGTAAYNDDLATRRADVVRHRLLAAGIPSDRIVLVIYGEADATDDVNINDRRVVIYASDRPTQEIVTASLDHMHARVAVWTRRGTLFQEEVTGKTPHPVLASRP